MSKLLEPGTGDQIIKCVLEQHDLCRNPRFEALSYCWGNTTDQGRIICRAEMMAERTTISVGRILEAALKKLRFPDQKRVLWEDALCINQEDNLEKGG